MLDVQTCRKGAAMGLKMLVLSLTGDCNLACRYCYASGQARRMMAWETARRAVELAASGGDPFLLQFSGGEPLLALPLLARIAAYVRDHRIEARMAVQTNGTLLTEEAVNILCDSNIGIGVSLDGRPALHDRQRQYSDGRGSAADVAAGIERLARRGVGIGLTCVVMAENVHSLTDVVDMAYYFGNVHRVGFDLLRAQGRGTNAALPRESDMAAAMREVFARREALYRLTGRRLAISQEEQARDIAGRGGSDFSHCYAMNGEGVHVDVDGGIYACSSFVGDERFFLGAVIQGVNLRRQQEVSAKMQRSMDFCRRCPDFAACGGGCFARWLGMEQEEPCAAECALKRAAVSAVFGKEGYRAE